MTEDFMIGIGHGLTKAELAKFTPYSPQTPGLQYTQRDYGSDGTVHKAGPFIRFNFVIMKETEYQAQQAQVGLTSSDTSSVTVWMQDENFNWHLFNGTAEKAAQLTRRGYWLYDVPLLIKDLVQLD